MLITSVSKPKCSNCLLTDNFSLAAVLLAIYQNTVADLSVITNTKTQNKPAEPLATTVLLDKAANQVRRFF